MPPKVREKTFGVYYVTYHRNLFTLIDMIETQRSCLLPESAANVGDGDTSVPLLADILPGIIRTDL